MPERRWATISRQRRAYEKIRPAPEPSRGISSPFRNAAKFVIKISNPIPYHLNTFLFYFYKKQSLRFRRSTPRLSIFKEGQSSFRLFRAILADDVETLPEHHAEQAQNAATNSAAGSAMYRESRSLPRAVRLTPILRCSCGRAGARAETAGAAPPQQVRLLQPKTRPKPRCLRPLPPPRRVQTKKPAESRASGGRTCRAKKISAASWKC